MPAASPFSIESRPRDGPTVTFWMMVTGAGSAPARRTIARSLASCVVKLPSIWARPPAMRSRITGAEYTALSRMMASRLPTFSPVTRSNSFAPMLSKLIETRGSLNSPMETRASVSTSPVMTACFLTR